MVMACLMLFLYNIADANKTHPFPYFYLLCYSFIFLQSCYTYHHTYGYCMPIQHKLTVESGYKLLKLHFIFISIGLIFFIIIVLPL